MPYNGPAPVGRPLSKELVAFQDEHDQMWKEHNFLNDGPPKRKFPWVTVWFVIILALFLIAIVTLPAVARRVHAPYVPAPRAPSTTELAQQTCTSHNESFVSWRASGIGVKEVFCASSNAVELTQRFIRAD